MTASATGMLMFQSWNTSSLKRLSKVEQHTHCKHDKSGSINNSSVSVKVWSDAQQFPDQGGGVLPDGTAPAPPSGSNP